MSKHDVDLQVVRTCNLRCTFCSHNVWRDPKGMMTWDLFAHVIQQLITDKHNIRDIIFVSAQGESLLHPKIFEMLELTLRSGFQVHLCTNGTPLNEARIARLAALSLHAMQLSFAGWDKESYESVYVGARFENVVRNLSQLAWALRDTRTSLLVNGVCKDQEAVEKTTAFLDQLGIRPIQMKIQLAHNWGGTVKTEGMSEQGGVWSHQKLGKLNICPMLITTPGIYVDGRVTACGCIDANGELEIGDITKQTLGEMRLGERYQALVGAFINGDVSHIPLCNKCEIPYWSN